MRFNLSLCSKLSTSTRAVRLDRTMATLVSSLAAVHTPRPSYRRDARRSASVSRPARYTSHRAPSSRRASASSSSSSSDASTSTADAEALLLSRLESVAKTRGASATPADERAIADAVTALERSGGIASPATSDAIAGTWRLLYTSKSDFDVRNPLGARVYGTAPGIEGFFTSTFGDENGRKMAAGMDAGGSSSPIQRTVTSLEQFTIQQAIRLRRPEDGDDRVDQVVQFGDNGYLRLSAAASVDGVNTPSRIDFAFDLAYFEIKATPLGPLPFGPLRLPYPVPFKLIGDEAKGWLDTTYLGRDVRISKGNKGTTFVLVREASDGTGTPLPYEF